MKKIIRKCLFILMATVTVFSSLAFSGCSLVKAFEKDVTISVVGQDGAEVKNGVVSIFNNMIMPQAPSEKNADGVPFLGWSPKKDYDPAVDVDVPIVNGKGVMHYADVKDYVLDGVANVYPIYANRIIKRHFLTVGWYAKESTSGLTEKMVVKFVDEFKEFLRSKGVKESQLNDIVLVSYSGEIAEVGGNVNKDGNVDILLGVGANLKTVGGIDYIDRYSGVMGGKTGRVIALLYESNAAKTAFNWMTQNMELLKEKI